VVIEERPLEGVSVDDVQGNERAYVQVGGPPAEHITHTISRPVRMTFKTTHSGAHEGLEIASSDGTITAIQFRSAMSPEMLDGRAA
jgi:hypothetical protein